MFDRLHDPLTFTAAIGSGLMAGLFFAFSSFVMAGLGRLPPASGVSAMQTINVTVLNPAFLSVFLGVGVLCAVLAAAAGLGWARPGAGLILAASLTYLIGCLGVTMACNVPLNNALAAVEPASPQAAPLWARYLREWVMWNHVRTAAPLLSMALFILALMRR